MGNFLWHEIFLSLRLCFRLCCDVGKSFCNTFYRGKQDLDSRSLWSTFLFMASLSRSFRAVFAVQEVFSEIAQLSPSLKEIDGPSLASPYCDGKDTSIQETDYDVNMLSSIHLDGGLTFVAGHDVCVVTYSSNDCLGVWFSLRTVLYFRDVKL